MSVLGVWTPIPMSSLSPVLTAGAVMSRPVAPLGVDLDDQACQSAEVVLSCKVNNQSANHYGAAPQSMHQQDADCLYLQILLAGAIVE